MLHRIGLGVVVLVLFGVPTFAQDGEPPTDVQRIDELTKRLEASETGRVASEKRSEAVEKRMAQLEQKLQPTREQAVKTARESYANAYKNALEGAAILGCYDVGGRQATIVIDPTNGNASVHCSVSVHQPKKR